MTIVLLQQLLMALLRIMYLYGKDQNLMFIDKCYRKRMDTFFKGTLDERLFYKQRLHN